MNGTRAILQVAAARGAPRVRISGCVARGEESASSDVDFLVDPDEGRGQFDLGGLLMDLRDLLGCEVDVTTPAFARGWPIVSWPLPSQTLPDAALASRGGSRSSQGGCHAVGSR